MFCQLETIKYYTSHRRPALRRRSAPIRRSVAGRVELQEGEAGKADRRATAVIL